MNDTDTNEPRVISIEQLRAQCAREGLTDDETRERIHALSMSDGASLDHLILAPGPAAKAGG